MIFMTVSGEESGLLGQPSTTPSTRRCRSSRIVANINIDMIGRNWPDTIVAIGRSTRTSAPRSTG